MKQRHPFWLALVLLVAATAAGCRVTSPAPAAAGHSCQETPAQDRWPEDYGLARGQDRIWLIDNGRVHRAGEQAKVGWRVVGAVDSLVVTGRSQDSDETVQFTLRDRVMPNGRDGYPTYWDAVSYLSFPASGCWSMDLRAGGQSEQIVLKVE